MHKPIAALAILYACVAAAYAQVNDNMYGVMSTGSGPIGQFETLTSTMRFKWTGSPAAGFSIAFGSGTITSPTATYTLYDFETTAIAPTWQYTNSALFRIKLDGTVVGWVEVDDSSPANLMWWSNGVGLTANRIDPDSDSVMQFEVVDDFPAYNLRPLESRQAPL